jgi:hypothetical protein
MTIPKRHLVFRRSSEELVTQGSERRVVGGVDVDTGAVQIRMLDVEACAKTP